jgi:transcriptional regulator with XRE-family HTH domain
MPSRGHRQPSTLAPLVGRRLRELREEAAISQAELARRVKTSPSHLNGIEAGRRSMTLASLEGYAQALNVDPAELLIKASTAKPASRSERAIVRLVELLREKDPEFVREVERFAGFLEGSVERVGAGQKRR